MRRNATPGLLVSSFSVALLLIYYLRREAPLEEAAIPMAEPPVKEARPVAVPAESTFEPTVAVDVLNPPTPVQVDSRSEAEPTHDRRGLLGDYAYREYTDRTPRPLSDTFGCKGSIKDIHCDLLAEEGDPTWSDATEKRLRALWSEHAPDLSEEFLFVMCKTTMCEVTYRFPIETYYATRPGERHFGAPYFSVFLRGLRSSTLTSELGPSTVSYAGPIISAVLKRIPSQDDR